jgi:hypothetical protein
MNKVMLIIFIAALAMGLGACAASSTSPIGVNCDYNKELLRMDMPLVCQGR